MIRGHRRTYIGALPGQIIQMMKKAGTVNPIFVLDEVDKMSTDFRGDPSAALMEVLDPELNHSFTDHYLDVEYDLSKVMFVCTANVLHTIPQPLQDRMEITPVNANDFLGVLKYREFWLEKHNEVGLTTGLAWTEVGGSVLVTEAAIMEGKGRLTPTGKLGEVMQESAQAAMSYIRSRSAAFGLTKDFYRNLDIHVHVPEGAIPKDGPSAGITICTSIVSALTKIPVRCDVTMTGEITLRGKVLPIGGVKEKLLAAHRMGLRTIVLPKDNEKDLAEIPQEILSSLTTHFVETMDEVLQIALERPIVPLEHAEVAPVTAPFVADAEKDKSLTN